MVARITGFRTRAQVGLVRPRSVSYNVTPQNGGLAVHWNGPRASNASHAQCEATWRNVQSFHMKTNGWVDVAYSIAFCNHGYALAGRGYGVRTAANGTNFGNQNYLAAYWIGGQGQTPTKQALDALDWIIVDFRKKGAGRRVRPHEDFTGSSCPGPDLKRHARSRDNNNISGPAPEPAPSDPWEEFWMSLSNTQRNKLEMLSDLPMSRIENIIALADTVGPNKLEILDDFASEVHRRGTTGRSYGVILNLFRNMRDQGLIAPSGDDDGRFKELAEFVDALRSMNTSARGLGWFGITAIRVLRAAGVPLDGDMMRLVRDKQTPTAEELNIDKLAWQDQAE